MRAQAQNPVEYSTVFGVIQRASIGNIGTPSIDYAGLLRRRG